MTRRARFGRDAAQTYRRACLPVAASALLAVASFSGACKPLPDDDDVKDGTEEPGPRRKGDDDAPAVKTDPCAKKATSKATKQRSTDDARPSKVLFNNDFESPNQPLVGDCGDGRLDQASGINTLFGTDEVQFTQTNTVEGVLLRDEKRTYVDPSGRGGRYAIGMLSKVQDDKLSFTFANDMPVVNVRLDLSGIAIKNCGDDVAITKPELRVSLYDGPISESQLGGRLAEPLDTAVVEGFEIEDAWTFKWQTAVIPLDASAATTGEVSVVFDLLEGGYAAIDNLSIVASTKKNVVDADTNGIPDDLQCEGGSSAGAGVGDDEVEPVTTRDAGPRASDAGAPAAPIDAGAPAAPPTATPTPPPPPPAPAPGNPQPPPVVTDSSRDDDAQDEEEDDEEEEEPARERDAGTRRRDGGILGGWLDGLLGN